MSPLDIAVTVREGFRQEVDIDSLAAGGRGVGRVHGVVWMVEGAIPGDRVVAEALHVRARLVEARAVEVVAPSGARREPPCPIQAQCGGCPWMVLGEADQREWKAVILADALRRVGGFRSLVPEPVIPSPRALGYRNKIELTFDASQGEQRLGFHPAGEALRVVDVERCLLHDAAAQRVLAEARSFFLEGPGRGEPALSRGRDRTRLIIRRSSLDGSLLVVLRGPSGPFLSARDFARHVADAVPQVAGVVRLIAEPGRRGGSRIVVLAGRPWIEESVAGIVVRLPAPTFFQINPEAAELVVACVENLVAAGNGMRILDLYAGVGIYGLRLAVLGAEVVACEADPAAVACARRAARNNQLTAYRVKRADVAAFLLSHLSKAQMPDAVIANPPRTGFGRGVAERIVALGPRQIVIVSCDPATLSRDLRALADGGYAVRRVIPFDLFPQTPHIETVTLLERE